MISVNDSIPAATITVINQQGQDNVSAADYFKGKKVALFALPGAFTPTCSAAHLPGYVVHFDDLKAKGVDEVACLSVNDSFVMKAWQDAQNAENLTMIADGNAALTNALGLTLDTGDFGGVRSQRYSMLIDDGVVKQLNVEPGSELSVSDAATLLSQLD
ncbi:peroxiredoxin [Arenicella chitinivorans]|uniref:Glutathione-dependent peroxiredoxin n=1 Tax=Arenicella chitinivorans TaxID=1329800 RepID=A0A918RS51_9GAMM|nr:peroxiredoxin [Arenicella chitinivorans]GHA10262.1 peroxiredoxin [Arenicella chitinivorans]